MTTPATLSKFDAAVQATLAGKRPAQRYDTAAGRFYEVDGEMYPSVTHILGCIGKPALINWAANQERSLVMTAATELYADLANTPPMSKAAYTATLQYRCGKEKAHRKALDKAADIGSQVHGLIEWNLRRQLGQQVGAEPRVVDDAQWAFMAFQDWAGSVSLKPRYIEQTVWSRRYGYAGTMDLLADVNGMLTLVDFKTGKAIYGEAHLQNVAYQVALDEMGHSTPAGGLIVRLPKVQTDPEFEVAVVPAVADLFPVFVAVRKLWAWHHEQELAYQAKRQQAG